MKFQEVRELIRLIDQSDNIHEFEYEQDGAIIKIKKGKQIVSHESFIPLASTEQGVVSEEASEVKVKEESQISLREENLVKITSPMVGTFYASPSPEAPSFISVGDRVTEKTVVCILEAMKLFNEIDADVSGEIVEILVNDGQLVEFGQPLFLVKKG